LLTWLIGSLIWLAIGNSIAAAKTSIEQHAEAISDAIATFAMALIGIMAGAVALATAIKEGFWIKQFRKSGCMTEFLFFYAFTIVCLFATHMLAVYALVNYGYFRLTITCVLVNTIQVLWVMYGVHRIVEQSDE
jgi:hypothetical protein